MRTVIFGERAVAGRKNDRCAEEGVDAHFSFWVSGVPNIGVRWPLRELLEGAKPDRFGLGGIATRVQRTLERLRQVSFSRNGERI